MTDLTKRIIYQTAEGVAVIIPCECGLSIEQIAKKDVPSGIKYKIVDSTDIPSDRTNRDMWTADFTTYDGVGE